MLDFSLSDEVQMIRKTVGEMTRKELGPKVEKLDEAGEFPVDFFQQMGELGLLATALPEEYGGGNAGLISLYAIAEEMARTCPSVALDVVVHSGIVSYGAILKRGSEEIKQRFLPKMGRGEMIGAIAMTEPNAGSDVANIQTRAVRDGDHYVLNGTKMFITNSGAPLPSVSMVLAYTDREKGPRGMSTFLVEKDTPGFTVGQRLNTLGMKMSHTNELIFENCRIPKENMVGEEGEGMKVALGAIDHDRLLCCALSTGMAQGCLDRALPYSVQRIAFGQPIAANQSLQVLLAKMHTHIHASRLMGYYSCWLEAQGQRFSTDAAMAKHFASKMAQESAWDAMAVHGGYGYMKEYQVEMFFRDNMVIELAGGASGILDLLISRDMLKSAGLDIDTYGRKTGKDS